MTAKKRSKQAASVSRPCMCGFYHRNGSVVRKHQQTCAQWRNRPDPKRLQQWRSQQTRAQHPPDGANRQNQVLKAGLTLDVADAIFAALARRRNGLYVSLLNPTGQQAA